MCVANVKQSEITNEDLINNLLRTLTMLEKAIERVGRRNYHNPSQYPEIFLEIDNAINKTREWTQNYRNFSLFSTFSLLLGMCLKELGELIGQLMVICKPLAGKKEVKKSRPILEQSTLFQSIERMLDHIGNYLNELKITETLMSRKIEEALLKAFEKHCSQEHKRRIRQSLSSRGKKTYIFPWTDKKGYHCLISDIKRFKAEVIEKLYTSTHAIGHKATCSGPQYSLIGYRSNPRRTVTIGGHQEEFPIRMIKCERCKEKFSLLPSFLPREKHFALDIIGQVFQNILLFGQSLQAALENLKTACREVKSKQTILNWLRWIGSLHPATILTRAGVKGTGYLQEDEGFEKEPNLRTYTVVMVESETSLVWHADYVDHVDEETLYGSFTQFVERIDFKVLGVTKDKWKPSTNALKRVFYRLWIGFCHRHCLKKFREALSEYKEDTGCSAEEVKRLYKKFKELLEKSTSKVSMEIKLNSLNDKAFKHPLLRKRLEELKENAVHYTCHKKRKGITRTTSIVDNFLKIVKRKLRQVESFRDKECTRILFQAMANVRNFVPFLSGAKKAHKSPFMLVQGETYDLPWIQVMNFHNAFLFTADAF